MDHTSKLATYCSELTLEQLPPEVIEQAKLCLLDYAANVYGSLELEAARQVVSLVRSQTFPGPATVLGCGFQTDPRSAVLVNGTLGEAIEAQDGLRYGGNHPGTAVIPAALAAAEEAGVGGDLVLASIVAGYEAANRPAMAMHPWHTLSGFLPTGTCGAFGAAAAVSRVRGYSPDLTLQTLGAAGYLAPLSMAEQLMAGRTIKIVQGGMAAQAGFLAADLARAGLTAVTQVLEGSDLKGGFTQITTRAEPKFELLSQDLGRRHTIMDIYFKPYSACRHTHGAAQATLTLLKQEKFRPEQVDKVTVHTYGLAQLAVGRVVQAGDSFVSAQFSLPFVVAACLLDGRLGPHQLTEKRLADPTLLALAKRVEVRTDETLNKMYPEKTATRVEVRLIDGREMAIQVDMPRGDPRDPMDRSQIVEKLRAFAGQRDQTDLTALIDRVLNLEHVGDIREITSRI